MMEEELKNPEVFLVRIRHHQDWNNLFGRDAADRTERDIHIHCILLKKYYNYSDDLILKELNIDMKSYAKYRI